MKNTKTLIGIVTELNSEVLQLKKMVNSQNKLIQALERMIDNKQDAEVVYDD